MKLFTIGPVQMHAFTRQVRGKEIPYFRTPEFSEFTFGIDRKLKMLLGTDKESEIVYLTASGTAAMEAAVINCFTPDDRVLVIAGGSFGHRFAEICTVHGIPHTDIELSFGEALTEAHLTPYENGGFTGLLVNLDESSTGQLYDIRMLHGFCERNGALLVVDAITSFLCDPYRMDEFGADVTIVSSQKGLALSPGMAMIALNARAVARAAGIDPHSLYFDFKRYFKDMERGQMPFTPAIGLMQELDDMMDRILAAGLDRHLADIADRAAYFRSLLPSIGAHVPEYPLSNAITPTVFSEPVAMELFRQLKTRGLTVNPTGGTMADYVMRVAHVGDLCRSDYDVLVQNIRELRGM